jgi:peptidyl-prolyl cis-trans isomerase B (cyclophilin B)
MKIAEIYTAKGLLKAELYEKETPITVNNFVTLAKKGFYDGLNFHRVLPGFVIQGGCPEGTGRGGPGYKIPCETSAERQFHDRGVLSMAHAGPNTGGSQFFVVLSRSSTAHLDRAHTCFGKVFEGLELLDDIKQGDKIEKIVIVDQE